MTRISSRFNTQPSVPAGTRQLILIVDDEDSVTVLAERLLTQEGYRVITARNGFQALDLFRKFQAELSLVILDFVMPILGGGEVLNEMLKLNPRVPVLLTSGFTSDEGLKKLLSQGLCGFIPKPLAQKKLLVSIHATIDAARTEKAGGFPSNRDLAPADAGRGNIGTN